MEEDSSGDMMMEEREELMVPFPATDGEPTLSIAHFLKPTLASTETHYTGFPLLSKMSNPESVARPSDVIYHGWRPPQEGWEEWVNRLRPLYGDTWKKVGIFDAIMASTINIKGRKVLHKEFMMKLAEKWCPETNTFMFSWGEATITLEDLMVLGGFPVLGQLVIDPVETEEMLALEEKLRKAHLGIKRKTGQIAREKSWLETFRGGGDEKSEHEAFLILWLSRYVFPGSYDKIAKDLFLIAINLSRGKPIAFGPAVLASIYRDLGVLKEFLLASSNLESGRFASETTKIGLCSPLGLVQAWVWERFPLLSPKPNPIQLEQPRLARWHEKQMDEFADDIGKALDSAGKYFEWRPYAPKLTNWNPSKLYKENDQCISVGPDMDSEVEVLVRCCRTSELVGFDCMEQYLPHRVGMQFGFDQDIPGFVKRLNDRTAEFAWNHYNRPIRDAKLYIPARLFESGVTERFRKQWRDHQLKWSNKKGARNDALHHGVKQQAYDVQSPASKKLLPLQKDDVIVEKRSGVKRVSSSVKKEVPDPVDKTWIPLRKHDRVTAEKQSGAKMLSSPSVAKGDPYCFKSDDENNVGSLPGKKMPVSPEVAKTNTNGGSRQQLSGKNDKRLKVRLAMLRKEMKKRNIRLRNLEKIVAQLWKNSSLLLLFVSEIPLILYCRVGGDKEWRQFNYAKTIEAQAGKPNGQGYYYLCSPVIFRWQQKFPGVFGDSRTSSNLDAPGLFR
ncbi:OLC1v1022764C1 [Oldenlandia corymbosa var. corymbosa]|uniref:OLC1v1022764C1 n=1 Tax=Oldenlandia corymbosa var. corymbosa TaxID=529605 RepID=A0AAV1C0Z3_OLDCO|nr:OLC1v1022764C1 [Oldenlandia corymbosa var. corymbosa]